MEVVLTRLRDFSCKEATFDDGDEPAVEGRVCRKDSPSSERRGPLDIESSLAWLRRELMEMRSQDQALVRQLMDLHAGIQELKQECVLDYGQEEEEIALEEDEEPGWDSGSEEGGSSTSSYSGEMGLYPSVYPLFRTGALHFGFQSKRAFNRRSSVP